MQNISTIESLLTKIDGFADYIFDSLCQLDSRCSETLAVYYEARKDRPSYSKRIEAISTTGILTSFRMHQMMALLISPLLITLCMPEVSSFVAPEHTSRAMRSLISITNSSLSRKTYGDYPMMLIIELKDMIWEIFPQWISAGGLHTIFAGVVKSFISHRRYLSYILACSSYTQLLT